MASRNPTESRVKARGVSTALNVRASEPIRAGLSHNDKMVTVDQRWTPHYTRESWASARERLAHARQSFTVTTL